MKTRKYIVVAICAVLLFAVHSCTKVYQHGIIKLAAPVVDSLSLIEGDIQKSGLSVFATKDNSDFYNNKAFRYKSEWIFAGYDHWSKGNYNFLAISPYGTGKYNWNPSASEVSFNFSYGYPCDGLCMTSHVERTYDGVNNDPVEFKMSHVNCRLVLKVCNKTNSQYIIINDCSIQKIRYKGKITLNPSGTEIEVNDSLSKESMKLYNSTIQDLKVTNNSIGNLYPEQVTIAPQEVGNATFSFTYADNSSTTPVLFSFKDVAEVTKWESGKTYVYTVEIFNSSAEINVSVQDWIDVNINL